LNQDIIALVVQAIGGAQASRAVQTGRGDPEKGGHIMLAGIVFQLGQSCEPFLLKSRFAKFFFFFLLVAITIYVALATEFLIRWRLNKPVRSIESPPMALQSLQREQTPVNERTSAEPLKSDATTSGGRRLLSKKMELVIAGLSFSTICIFIRCVIRCLVIAPHLIS
jgi:hypothetical protein